MYCPRCNVELGTVVVKNVKVETCNSCDGIWLDKFELTKITNTDINDLEASEICDSMDKDHSVEDTANEHLSCPKCSSKMERAAYLGSNVHTDICLSCHGLWLDDGEIKDIINYIHKKNGVLSEEETLEIKSKLQKTREEYEKSDIHTTLKAYLTLISKFFYDRDYNA